MTGKTFKGTPEYTDRFVTNEDGARGRACAVSKELKLRTLVLPFTLDDGFPLVCSPP